MLRLFTPLPTTALRGLLGVAALFSGIALLGTLILDFSLPLGFVATAMGAGLTFLIAFRSASVAQRKMLRQIIRAGAPAGLLATVCYDATRTVLSMADPSPYNPFEAVRAFGILFTGGESTVGWVIGVGFHILNGTAFGVAWCLAFGAVALRGRWWALGTGIAWGLFLEMFQITLYPGWLSIRAYTEFVTISASGHLVYGAILGLLGARWLRRAYTQPITAATVEDVRAHLEGSPPPG